MVANLRNKRKYVVHYRALVMYLRVGLKLEEMHRVLMLKESAWMEPYICLNIELRKKTKSYFEK